MYIELISKTCKWQGDEGVVMDIKARTYPRDLTTLSEQDAENTRNARMGINISISGLGEVTANEQGNPTWYGPRPIPSDDMEVVQEWLVSSGVLSEWGKESARYVSTLSRVDLPCAPEDTGVTTCNYLRYHMKMGEDGMCITVAIHVTEKHSVISVGLRDGDDKYEDNCSMGLYDSTITGPVTTHTVMAVVSKSLDKLWDLLELPLVID